MKIREVEKHLHSLPTFNERTAKDDRFLAGDPEDELRGIAITWTPTLAVLRRAVELDCNLVVTHEPLYYTEEDESVKRPDDPGVQLKRELVESAGLAVLRCHGTWDSYPELGIHASWVRGLGWEDQYEGDGVCRVGPTTLGKVAEHVLERIRPLGMEALQVVGDLESEVNRVGVGTGVLYGLGALRGFYKRGVDTVIVTEIWYATDDRWAQDVGLNLIIAEHYISEAWGIENLAKHLSETFPDTPVHHLPTGCSFRCITGKA